MFRKHILPYFGEMKLNKITATTVRQWQTVMMSNPKKFKKTYLKSINNQLSALFNYACKYYGLPENPAKVCGSMGRSKADKMDSGRWMSLSGLRLPSATRLSQKPSLTCCIGAVCAQVN